MTTSHSTSNESQPSVEVWKWVKGFKGYYKVPSKGRVRSVDRWVGARNGKKKLVKAKMKALTTIGDGSGRQVVRLFKNNTFRIRYVHQVVLESFVGLCPPGMECCHFPDRDVRNNNVENLRWGTSAENKADMKIHGTTARGERCGKAKLKQKEVEYIKRILECNKQRGVMARLARKYKVSPTTIWEIKKGWTWT